MLPAYVVVSGPPGSGKSTVARAVATSLDLPLFAKDTIKEALMDTLGVATVDDSRRLGAATIDVLLAMARENGRGVLESTWQATLVADRLLTLPGPIVEVFCRVDPEVARARYRARASSRHPGHFDDAHLATDELWSGERAQPIDGGWPLISLDTTHVLDIDEVTARVRPLLRSISTDY